MRGYHKTAYSAFMLSLLVAAPVALIQIAFPALTLLPYGPGYAGHPGVVQWLMFDLVIVGVFAPYHPVGDKHEQDVVRVRFDDKLVGLVCGLLGFPGAALWCRRFCRHTILAHLVLLAPCLLYLYRIEPEFMKGLPLLKLIPVLAGLGAASYACARWLHPAVTIALGVLLALAFWQFRERLLAPILSIRSPAIQPES